ncbi:MAG: hypothetical protein ABIF77_19440 [bacterium]
MSFSFRKILIGTALVLLLGGCSNDKAAPPVDEHTVAAGLERGVTREQLESGRDLFLNACTRCHRPMTVADYDAETWTDFLQDMTVRAQLDREQTEQVTAYVLTTRAVLDSMTTQR